MKRNILDFIRRGLCACGLGPIILAILYLVLENQGVLQTLTVREVCLGIFSLTALAFVAGGMNVVYQMERIPLMVAILIHGLVLYISYLVTYLINGWLDRGLTPILAFSAIFVIGFLGIWACIYAIMRRKTAKLNEVLKKKLRISEN